MNFRCRMLSEKHKWQKTTWEDFYKTQKETDGAKAMHFLYVYIHMKLLETSTVRKKAEYVSVQWSFSILRKLSQDPVQTQNPGDLGSL